MPRHHYVTCVCSAGADVATGVHCCRTVDKFTQLLALHQANRNLVNACAGSQSLA